MELKGKIINFLGDSITEGVGATDTEHAFFSQVGKKTGAVCNGYGIGGTRIAKNRAESENAVWDRHFNSRVAEMDKNADVVFVFGGTNDFGHGDGALGLPDSHDEYTFYGAMNVLCENLINTFPTARIVFLTPLHRVTENSLLNECGIRNMCPLSGYVEIIKEVCRKYSLPVIDLFADAGINPNIPPQKELYMNDGLHPNNAGHEKVADFIIAQMKML